MVEKVLNRLLKQSEVVHHINCMPSDNRNCNLLVCDNSYHRYLHNKMGRLYAQKTFINIGEIQ